jgi:hypothetical protein
MATKKQPMHQIKRPENENFFYHVPVWGLILENTGFSAGPKPGDLSEN